MKRRTIGHRLMAEYEAGKRKRERQARRLERHRRRPWWVVYDLAYDGGGSEWTGYYKARWQALVALWWNRHVTSYGGEARLYENPYTVLERARAKLGVPELLDWQKEIAVNVMLGRQIVVNRGRRGGLSMVQKVTHAAVKEQQR
jgi:hypothetical protein